MAGEYVSPGTSPWVLSVALVTTLREEGLLSDAAFAPMISLMRKAADAYQAAGQPADAGDVRADADRLEAGQEIAEWGEVKS